MTPKRISPTIAITAYEYLLARNDALTVEEIYDSIVKEGLYKFGARSRREGIGILALSIKRHMANSKRRDKFDCMLFKSDDGLAHNKTSTVLAIRSARGYIIKLARLLAK